MTQEQREQELKDKVSRLPKWAQEHIENLNTRLRETKKMRDEVYALHNGGQKSRIYVRGYQTRPDIYLPEDSVIAILLEDKTRREQELAFGFRYGAHDFDRTSVVVRSSYSQLVVKPEVANTINISTVD